MALFKILKGASTNLPNVYSTSGYAYFTPDDGRFYIDIDKESETDPVVIGNNADEIVQLEDGNRYHPNRICINQKLFTYNDYDILDCGGALLEDSISTLTFNCGNSSN